MPKNSYGLSASELLDDLKEDGVEMRTFVSGNKYYLELEKEVEGVKLNVKNNTHTEFLTTVREAYDKWHSMMDGKIRNHLGFPQIEHHETPPPFDSSVQSAAPDSTTSGTAPLTGIDELHEEAGVGVKDFKDEIPF